MYNAQKNKFNTETAYVEGLGTQTKSAPIVYNPYSGYGYVYNLLLGVDLYINLNSLKLYPYTGIMDFSSPNE